MDIAVWLDTIGTRCQPLAGMSIEIEGLLVNVDKLRSDLGPVMKGSSVSYPGSSHPVSKVLIFHRSHNSLGELVGIVGS